MRALGQMAQRQHPMRIGKSPVGDLNNARQPMRKQSQTGPRDDSSAVREGPLLAPEKKAVRLLRVFQPICTGPRIPYFCRVLSRGQRLENAGRGSPSWISQLSKDTTQL